MGYRLRYRESARYELDLARQTYGGEFGIDMSVWLNELAEDCATKPESRNAVDLTEFLEW